MPAGQLLSSPLARVLCAFAAGAAALLSPLPALALDPSKALTQYVSDSFGTEQGLPQNSVLAEVRTPDGYLWLGTWEGLVRFDGVRFVTYDRENTPALRAAWVTSLLADSSGTLWIGTNDGLLSHREGLFERVALPPSSIKALAAGSEGALWIGTAGSGLLRRRGGEIEVFRKRDGLCGEHIASLSTDAAGVLWIGTVDGGLCSFSAGRFERGIASEAIGRAPVSRVLVHGGVTWIATQGAGLFRFEDGKHRVFSATDGLPSETIFDLLIDRENNLFAGTSHGLARLHAGTVSALLSKPGALLDVRSLLEDPEGSVWVGTDAGGLIRLKDGSFSTISLEEGLGFRNVRAVLAEPSGGVWMATSGGGLSLYRSGQLTTFTRADGLADDVVMGLFNDSRGALWAGSFAAGVSMRPAEGGPFRTLGKGDGLSVGAIAAFAEHQGALYIGGDRLVRYRDGAFTEVGPSLGVPSAQILCLHEDRSGVLWICTDSQGVGQVSGEKATFYTVDDGLADNNVAAVSEDSKGALWIATGRGLSRLDRAGIKTFSAADGLYESAVHKLIWDDAGTAWMSTNKGIASFRRDDLEAYEAGRIPRIPSKLYGAAQGMKNRECNGGVQPAGTKASDGRIYFATIDGAVVVDPGKLTGNAVPPPVHVEELRVDRRAVKLGGALELPAGARDLEIDYTALSMIDPGRVAFRYKLSGYDRDWVDAGPRRSAYYTNLPPGPYRFRVIASNNDGVWNETGAEVSFALLPFFYQRPLFWALVAVALALAAAAAVRARLRYLVKRQEELARHNDELEAALAVAREAARLKGEFVANVSHELRTPLNAIINIPEGLLEFFPRTEIAVCSACASRFELEPGDRVDAAAKCPECRAEGAMSRATATTFSGDPELVARYLATLHRSGAHLSKLIDGVLDFSKLEAGKMQVTWEDVQLSELFDELRATASGLASPRGIELNFHIAAAPTDAVDSPLSIRTDRTKCTQILINLISNAIKFSAEGTRVSVGVERDGDAFLFRVTDQGIGIAAEHHGVIFDSFHQVDGSHTRKVGGTGLGLAITKQLVLLLGGSIWIESEVGKGSTFFVRLGAPGLHDEAPARHDEAPARHEEREGIA